MIIDMHAHLWTKEIPAPKEWDNIVSCFAALSGKPEERIRQRMAELYDYTGDMTVKAMDEAGIDISVLLVCDFGLARWVGPSTLSLEENHKFHIKVAEAHPGRFINFLCIDPRRPEAVEFLEKGVKEWGMKGLKVMPFVGFYPNDPICYPLYAKAQELGIPVFFHTGPNLIGLYSKYAHPIHLDDIANDFQELKIIVGRAGLCWWFEAASIVMNKPNMYLELGGWQGYTRHRIAERFYSPLRRIIDTVGAKKVLFGSDFPGFKLALSQADWVKMFKEPPDSAKEAGIEFSEDEINAILGENAAELLGVK